MAPTFTYQTTKTTIPDNLNNINFYKQLKILIVLIGIRTRYCLINCLRIKRIYWIWLPPSCKNCLRIRRIIMMAA